MRIQLAEIYVGDRQRKDYGKGEMEDLQKDMEENGQIQAITVRPPNAQDLTEEDYGQQPWVLIAGGRRLNAAILLGWQDIEGYAREEMSTLVANILELHENLKRKPMSWQEQVDAKSQIVRLRRMENPEITDREIAAELGESPSNFSRDLKTAEILEKNPGLRKANSKHSALNAGKILQEHADQAQRVAQEPAKLAVAVVGNDEARIKTSDAQSFVAGMEPDTIDLTLIDGPYGYNFWKQGQKSTKAEGDHLSSYDDSPETVGPMYRELFPELVRVTRPTGWLVMFCGKETYDFLEELAKDCCATHGAYRHDQFPTKCSRADSVPNGEGCRFLVPEPYPWYWYRPNSRNHPRFPNLHGKNFVELILVCNLGKGRLVRSATPNIKIHDADYGTDRVHANQKPVPLYRDLIEDFTFSGDSVLDCFFGSGNSLGAAASLARVPYGCDKNPEMLPFALGKVRQLQQAISPETIKASRDRFLRGLANPYAEDGAEDEEGVMPVAAGPRQIDRKANEVWEFEVYRIGEKHLGYLKYDRHNMGQLHARDGEDRDSLEFRLGEACLKLQTLSTLGVIDPCCCSPEEAMEALRSYEAAEDEDAIIEQGG